MRTERDFRDGHITKYSFMNPCFIHTIIRISIKCYITFRQINISSELTQHLFTISSFSLLSIMHAFEAKQFNTLRKTLSYHCHVSTVKRKLEQVGGWLAQLILALRLRKMRLGFVQMLQNLCSICTKTTDSGSYSQKWPHFYFLDLTNRECQTRRDGNMSSC